MVSLRDPLSGTRIVKPARFLGTDALVSFDLDTFLNMAKRSRKWQCPHSMRHSRVQDLQADTFMTHILSRLTVSSLRYPPGRGPRIPLTALKVIGACPQKLLASQVWALAQTPGFMGAWTWLYVYTPLWLSFKSLEEVFVGVQDYQDVMEVEVSPEGEWRPAGGRYAWMQVTEQPITGQLPLAHKVSQTSAEL